MEKYFTSLQKYINFKVFALSFIIGLIFIYILGPERKKIVVFPTLDNYAHLFYKDKIGQCFQFDMSETPCTQDSKTIPIQTSS